MSEDADFWNEQIAGWRAKYAEMKAWLAQSDATTRQLRKIISRATHAIDNCHDNECRSLSHLFQPGRAKEPCDCTVKAVRAILADQCEHMGPEGGVCSACSTEAGVRP